MYGEGAVSWASKSNQLSPLSTTEADYQSVANGVCQAVWVRNVLEEIGSDQREETVIYYDSSSN